MGNMDSSKVLHTRGRRPQHQRDNLISKEVVSTHHASSSISATARRLEELLVFEILSTGECHYLRGLTVRGLYRHVLKCISNRPGAAGRHRRARTFSSMSNFAIGDDSTNSPPPPASLSSPFGNPGGDGTHVALSADEGGASPWMGRMSRKVSQTSTAPNSDKKKRRKENLRARQKAVSSTSTSGLGLPTGTTNANITYRERLGGYLHPRDMRRLVTAFSTSNEPELIVRRHVMLLNFDPLRSIILRDRLLVLVPNGADSILIDLENRVLRGHVDVENFVSGGTSKTSEESGQIRGGHPNFDPTGHEGGLREKFGNMEEHEGHAGAHPEEGENTNDDNTDNDEYHEMEGRKWYELPFELQCTDAVLDVVNGLLVKDTHDLQLSSQKYILHIVQNQNGAVDDQAMAAMGTCRQKIRAMAARVRSFVDSLNRVLDEDEDMALMNLSRLLTHPERFIQPVPQEVLEEESDEPELILESHRQSASTLINILHLMEGQIDSATDLLDRQLNTLRNRLLFANMVVSVGTLSVALGTVVSAFFGMNTYPLTSDPPPDGWFDIVVFSTVATMILLGVVVLVYLISSGIVPNLFRYQ